MTRAGRRIAGLGLTVACLASAVPAAADDVVRPWGAHTVLEAHATRARAVAFDATGRLLVSGGSDRRLRVWDATTWRPLAEWAVPQTGAAEP